MIENRYVIADAIADRTTEYASLADAKGDFEALKRYYEADTYGAERQRLIDKGWRASTLDRYTSDLVLLVANDIIIDTCYSWCADIQSGQALAGTEKAHLIDDLRHLDDDEF